jgi:hypothetical protein
LSIKSVFCLSLSFSMQDTDRGNMQALMVDTPIRWSAPGR